MKIRWCSHESVLSKGSYMYHTRHAYFRYVRKAEIETNMVEICLTSRLLIDNWDFGLTDIVSAVSIHKEDWRSSLGDSASSTSRRNPMLREWSKYDYFRPVLVWLWVSKYAAPHSGFSEINNSSVVHFAGYSSSTSGKTQWETRELWWCLDYWSVGNSDRTMCRYP